MTHCNHGEHGARTPASTPLLQFRDDMRAADLLTQRRRNKAQLASIAARAWVEHARAPGRSASLQNIYVGRRAS